MNLSRFVNLARQGTLVIVAATAIVATVGAGRAFAQQGAPPIPPTPAETQMGSVPPPPAPEEATPPPLAAPAFEETPPLASPAPVVPPPVVGPPYPDRRSDILLPQPYTHWVPQSRMGLALLVGGGVTDFTDGSTRSETGTGGSWTARLAVATRRIIGFDASYVGGANTLHGLGAGNATLVRNGLEGALRINAPLYSYDTLFEPYALAGVGWNTYRLANYNAGTSSVSAGSDNTVTIPLGVGFALGYRGFMADVRYTLRPTYDQSVFVNQTSGALSNWDLGGMLGYEF
jgi:hypothetical protein